MKNVRSMVLATITMLFMGIANIHAQVELQKSVLITGYVYATRTFTIFTVGPDYDKTQVTENTSDKVKDFDVAIKKEIDKWLAQGYEVIDSSISATSDSVYRILYTLIKKLNN